MSSSSSSSSSIPHLWISDVDLAENDRFRKEKRFLTRYFEETRLKDWDSGHITKINNFDTRTAPTFYANSSNTLVCFYINMEVIDNRVKARDVLRGIRAYNGLSLRSLRSIAYHRVLNLDAYRAFRAAALLVRSSGSRPERNKWYCITPTHQAWATLRKHPLIPIVFS